MARRPGPGLASTGNRVLLSIGIGWIVWFFGRLLGADTAPGLVLLVAAAAIAYAIITAAVRR